jgi:hypothetical protein
VSCDWCERTDSITTINGLHACTDHLEVAMAQVFTPLRAFLEGR